MGKHGPLSASQLVKMAADLPEVVLREGDVWTNVTVRGKGFAWVNHPEERAMIKAHHDERDALLATAPAVYEAGWATVSSAWVRVRLELADPEEVFELLEEAWRMTATKRAIRAFDESRRAGQRDPQLTGSRDPRSEQGKPPGTSSSTGRDRRR